MTIEKAVEKAAWHMYDEDCLGITGASPWPTLKEYAQDHYRIKARAAIRAFLAELCAGKDLEIVKAAAAIQAKMEGP